MVHGLIGEKLGHSFSKEIHKMISNYQYELKEIPKNKIDSFMRMKNFKAINVTIPYKETVIPYLHCIDEKAKLIGSVNTIVNKFDMLYGYNTDYYGLKALIEKHEIKIENKKVLILGTGGTSKTAYVVVNDMNPKEVIVVGRNKSTNNITYEEAYEKHNDAEVIINTTPVGMYPNVEGLIIDVDKFPYLEGVVDVIYNPLNTKLVIETKKRNIKACTGLYMLVAQAVYASNIFLEKALDTNLERIDEVYNKILSKKQNIVLIGMPSSGKSHIAKLVSRNSNKKAIDLDTKIEEKLNMPISDFLNETNEEEFRDIESKVVEEYSKENNLIISTGGGVIKREKNIDMLRQNGIIIFIDRKLEYLMPTDDRPLTNDIDKLTKTYNERYPLYKKYADYVIDNNGLLVETVSEIIRRFL